MATRVTRTLRSMIKIDQLHAEMEEQGYVMSGYPKWDPGARLYEVDFVLSSESFVYLVDEDLNPIDDEGVTS